jgi:uncharacterized protein YjbI with pentapeptide repeats
MSDSDLSVDALNDKSQVAQDVEGKQNQVIGNANDSNVFNVSAEKAVIFNVAPEVAKLPDSEPRPSGIGSNPYKGLLAFQETDSDLFFGRQKQIERLSEKFKTLCQRESATRFLMIYGPSGTGKSSLVRAGLIPALIRQSSGSNAPRIITLVPESHPLESLARSLARIVTDDPTPITKTQEFVQTLSMINEKGEYEGLRQLADMLHEVLISPLILFVDQLEEVFDCENPAESDAFIDNLLCAAADRSKRVSIIATLQDKSLGAAQKNPKLNQLISSQVFIVPAMDKDELREAITRPAELANYPLDPSTVNLLIQETKSREGALPLLQFTLTQIWEGLLRGKAPGDTFEKIGGVGGALAQKADQVYELLTTDEQSIARKIFIELVNYEKSENISRRRVKLSDLSSLENQEQIRKIIALFSAPQVRIITLVNNESHDMLEVTHEALFSSWPKYSEWIDEVREVFRERYTIERLTREWIESGRKKEYLIHGRRLKDAIKFQEVNSKILLLEEAKCFIFKSTQNQRNTYFKNIGLILCSFIVIAIILGIHETYKYFTIMKLLNSLEEKINDKNINGYRRINEIEKLVRLGVNISEKFKDKTLFGVDLSNMNLSKAELSNITFSGCKIDNSKLYRGNLSGTKFTLCSIKNTDFNEANLSGVYLSYVDFTESKFNFSKLKNAKGVKIIFQKSEFKNADFDSADLYSADFTGVNAHYAKFDESILPGANFSDSNLQDATFFRARLMESNFQEADLSRADFTLSDLYSSNLKYANLQKAKLGMTHVQDADFLNSNLRGTFLYSGSFGFTDESIANFDIEFIRKFHGFTTRQIISGCFYKKADYTLNSNVKIGEWFRQKIEKDRALNKDLNFLSPANCSKWF